MSDSPAPPDRSNAGATPGPGPAYAPTAAPVSARHVIVRGRVQRVYFRESCRAEALAHFVAGYVTNLDDGTVEALFEGASEAVDAMVRWCHHGPERALVTAVEIVEVPPRGVTAFEVIRPE